MVSKSAILAVRIVTDTKSASAGLDSYGSAVERLGGKLDRLTIPAGLALAAITAVSKRAVDAASEAQQSAGAVEAVFGAYSDGVKQSAQDAAASIGLAESQYSQLAAVIGSQLKNTGTPMDQVASQTDELIRLGGDLAATYGGSVSDAVGALSSLLRGERDPIERYGVSIKQATIDAKKAELGLTGLTGEADAAADSQATLALLYEQSAAASGQFARETDTLAGSQQIANAQFEDAMADLGESLLPTVTALTGAAADLAGIVADNSEAFLILIGVLGAVAGAVLIVQGAIKVYETAVAIATVAQWLWNIAMDANPIGLLIIAIGLLIAIIVLIVTHWEEFGQVFGDVIDAVMTWWNDLVDSFAHGFDQIVGWVQDVIGWFQQLLGIQSSATGGTAAVAQLGTFSSAPAVPVGIAPFSRAAPRLVSASSGPTIIIQGAIDPDSTARQIRSVMTRFQRKQGTIFAGGRQWQ